MGHLGIKEAYDENQTKSTKIGHYLLWIVLGLSFAIVRLMSATIMGLDVGGEEALISMQDATVSTPFGIIRQIDIVVAPLMFFLYLATGILAKDGVKNLISNESFKKWLEERAENTRGFRRCALRHRPPRRTLGSCRHSTRDRAASRPGGSSPRASPCACSTRREGRRGWAWAR